MYHVKLRTAILCNLLALFGIMWAALPAEAATPVYAGTLRVTTSGSMIFDNGATGCLLVVGGVASVAACPIGTVAFQAAAPFTVTGTGPYVIGCATCFTTAGGTITGPVTFSQAITLGSSSYGPTSATINGPLTVTSAGTIDSSGGGSLRFRNSTTGSTQFVNHAETTVNVSFDDVGDATFLGNVTASNFFTGSRRSYKQDIQPLSLDALQVLHDTDWAAYRYKPKYGDPRLPHIGFIADDTPSILSGEHHDHFDAQALATVDAKAILQLQAQLQVLYILSGCSTLLGLFVFLGMLYAHARKANEEG